MRPHHREVLTAAYSPIRPLLPRRRSSRRRPQLKSSMMRCNCSVSAAIRVTSRLRRMARDAHMFTIGGGTAQVLRTIVASKILG